MFCIAEGRGYGFFPNCKGFCDTCCPVCERVFCPIDAEPSLSFLFKRKSLHSSLSIDPSLGDHGRNRIGAR